MNVTINSQVLAGELRLLNQVAEPKGALPILANVLITAQAGALHFYATDLDIGFHTACRADVTEEGSVTLPVKRLLDLVEAMPDADVVISSQDATRSAQAHVKVTSGAFVSRIQTMSPEDFPGSRAPEGEATEINLTLLHGMIDRVSYALTDKSPHVPNGALLTLTGEVLALVATDGKRLVVTTAAFPSKVPTSVILPAKTLAVLKTLFSGSAVAFSQTDQHLFFWDGSRILKSRLLEARYPNYDSLIPKASPHSGEVNVDALASSLRRVGLMSENDQGAYFEFAEGALVISSRSAAAGEAAERIACTYSGEPMRVCASWRHLLDFLESTDGSSIQIKLTAPTSPLLLVDGPDHLGVVLARRA